MPGVRGKAVYVSYRAAAALAEALPERVAARLARIAGRASAKLMRGRAEMARRHQRRLAPDSSDAAVDIAVRDVFDSYARYWLEMFRLPREVRDGNVVAKFAVEGYEHVEKGLARGNGVIYALPHLGGWEWGAAWMAVPPRSQRMLAVVEALEPPELRDWFVRQREEMGLEIVSVGPEASGRVLKALRDNRIVCLVSDRDLSGDGVEVEFLGERTTLPAGPATLALRTGATLLPLAVYFRPDGGHHAVIRPPVPTERAGRLRDDVARITQQLAREFETLIRAAPAQWHLLQPNWPSDEKEASG